MKNTNKITYILIIATFIVGDNVLTKFGMQFQIYKLFLIFLCTLSAHKIFYNGMKQFPEAIALLIFITSYTIFKILSGGRDGNTNMGIIALLPVLIFITFISTEKKSNFYKYKRLLYFAYLFECCIAIIERVIHKNLFRLETSNASIFINNLDILEFRSLGLYGHPLQNALVVFTFILFILIYETNMKLKYFLSFIGIVSIFCFNTRAAIVLSISCIALYIFYWFLTTKGFILLKIVTIICLFTTSLILYKLYSFGLIGGRLSSMGLYDDNSAYTRIAVWSIFDYYNLHDFVIGISQSELEFLQYKVGLYAIENFWLHWLLSYGLIFVIGLILFYIPIINKLFKSESKFNKIFIIFPFLILASTNPSLAVSIVPLTSFLLLSYIMPKTK